MNKFLILAILAYLPNILFIFDFLMAYKQVEDIRNLEVGDEKLKQSIIKNKDLLDSASTGIMIFVGCLLLLIPFIGVYMYIRTHSKDEG